MRAEYINAFLAPSVEVLQKMARIRVRVGKIERLTRPLAGDALNIIIGLSGNLSGSVVLTSGREVAWALACRIMREELGPDAQEDVLAVLSELANTIVGNATGHLYQLGISGGITPPTVIMGSAVSFDFFDGTEGVLVPIETEFGCVEMAVSLICEKPHLSAYR